MTLVAAVLVAGMVADALIVAAFWMARDVSAGYLVSMAGGLIAIAALPELSSTPAPPGSRRGACLALGLLLNGWPWALLIYLFFSYPPLG